MRTGRAMTPRIPRSRLRTEESPPSSEIDCQTASEWKIGLRNVDAGCISASDAKIELIKLPHSFQASLQLLSCGLIKASWLHKRFRIRRSKVWPHDGAVMAPDGPA